jgi:hypothetical protein
MPNDARPQTTDRAAVIAQVLAEPPAVTPRCVTDDDLRNLRYMAQVAAGGGWDLSLAPRVILGLLALVDDLKRRRAQRQRRNWSPQAREAAAERMRDLHARRREKKEAGDG